MHFCGQRICTGNHCLFGDSMFKKQIRFFEIAMEKTVSLYTFLFFILSKMINQFISQTSWRFTLPRILIIGSLLPANESAAAWRQFQLDTKRRDLLLRSDLAATATIIPVLGTSSLVTWLASSPLLQDLKLRI